MSADLWVTAALIAVAVAVLIVGILIGVGIGRDDERARQIENRQLVDALERGHVRGIR